MDNVNAYSIRLANHNDIDNIMKFIDIYWRKNHIMSIDKELFLYEFEDGEIINFVIAENKDNLSIDGIFGFLRCSKTLDLNKKDIWGSFWKVKEDIDAPLLGIELAKKVYELTGARMHIGNGANPNTTVPLRRVFFREKCNKMKQYYKVNPNIIDFNVAVINSRIDNVYEKTNNRIVENPINSIKEFNNFIDIDKLDSLPYKDSWYINKRYFNHPYYTYDLVSFKNCDTNEKCVLVTRTIEIEGVKILRIVDFIGEHKVFRELGNYFNEIIKTYEFIDFYVYGFEEEYIIDAGFIINDGENIIPNFYEPFSQTNEDIWVHYKYEGTTFFKADGDQDRPNLYSGG